MATKPPTSWDSDFPKSIQLLGPTPSDISMASSCWLPPHPALPAWVPWRRWKVAIGGFHGPRRVPSMVMDGFCEGKCRSRNGWWVRGTSRKPPEMCVDVQRYGKYLKIWGRRCIGMNLSHSNSDYITSHAKIIPLTLTIPCSKMNSLSESIRY